MPVNTKRYVMLPIKNLVISILIGIGFWIVGFVAYQFFEPSYDLLSLVILPILIGILNTKYQANPSKISAIIFCSVSIFSCHFARAARVLVAGYDSVIPDFWWVSLEASLYIWPIQILFCMAGVLLVSLIRGKRVKRR